MYKEALNYQERSVESLKEHPTSHKGQKNVEVHVATEAFKWINLLRVQTIFNQEETVSIEAVVEMLKSSKVHWIFSRAAFGSGECEQIGIPMCQVSN